MKNEKISEMSIERLRVELQSSINLNALLKAQLKEQAWVRVGDGLPEDGAFVLINSFGNSSCFVLRYDHITDEWYDGNGSLWSSITHWQPITLPQPEAAKPCGQGGERMNTLVEYLENQREWSRVVFGEGLRTEGILEHIALESNEVRDAPEDVEEWVDIIILALDGAWRAGFQPEEIVEAMATKQIKNINRKWHVPESEDEPVTHIKETGDPK